MTFSFVRFLFYSILWSAAAGIANGSFQIFSRPYWFHSTTDRLVYLITLAVSYAAAGTVPGILAGAGGALAAGRRRRSAGRNGHRLEAVAAAVVTAALWGGFSLHRFHVRRFFSAEGWAVNILILAAAILLLSIAVATVKKRPAASRFFSAAVFCLVALFALSALIGGATRRLRDGADGRWNVLLIAIDTLRADRLSCYGNPRSTSPAIDRLAGEGILFADAVSPAPFTQPSGAALLTGLSPGSAGVVNHPNRLPPDRTTLAERFRDAGYRTAFANPHPLLTPAWGFEQGFDEYRYIHKPSRFDATLLATLLDRFRLRRPRVGYRADRVTDYALELLHREEGRPFFLYIHYLDPHFEYTPPRPFDRIFAARGETPVLMDERFPDGRRHIFDLEPDLDKVRQSVELYDGEIAYTDREIGRLLAALDEAGLSEKTLVAITSDHGENLGEQGLFFAHTHLLYDPTQRIPLLLRLPGRLPAGRIVDEQVTLIDVAPTLLRIAGVGALPGPEGTDLTPLVDGTGLPERPAFAENGRTIVGSGEQENPRWYVEGDAGKWRMVRTGRWKLIRIPKETGPVYELYDLWADPGETDDLADERSEVVQRWAPSLEAWVARVEGTDVAEPIADDETLEGLRSLGYITDK